MRCGLKEGIKAALFLKVRPHRPSMVKSYGQLKMLALMFRMLIQGGFEFSEGTSAKWIIDVEIKKCRSEYFFACRDDQSDA
jgi:hypothetical protein